MTPRVIGPEIWKVEAGRVAHKGKKSVVEDPLGDKRGSGANTPIRSRLHTPIVSASVTPAGSGAETGKEGTSAVKKKKKLTRNQMKAQEERRRLRKLHWLTHGGPKPEDTDED